MHAGAYKAESYQEPGQRRSLAASALASWNGNGGGSQAGISNAAASAVQQVLACTALHPRLLATSALLSLAQKAKA